MQNAPVISRVLVTGASGFVGRHIVDELLRQGFGVSALVRNPDTYRREDVTAYSGSILNRESIIPAAQGCDAIIHLVGIIAENKHDGTFEQVHVTGTQNVIAAAKATGVNRFVHMSALGTRPQAASRYHQTKWQAEESLRQSGLQFTIFRPSMILGPDGDFARMLVNWARGKAAPFFFMPYFGAGILGQRNTHHLQPINVADLAELFCHALNTPAAIGKTYDVGGPQTLTWPEFLSQAALAITGKNKPAIGIPAWWAKFLASLPLPLPFNRDQVVMSQEDNTCNLAQLQADFPGFRPQSAFSVFRKR